MENKDKRGISVPAVRLFQIGLVALLLVVIGQLFNLQILRHDDLEGQALRQQTTDTVIEPQRGSILDRNGNELAISASAYMVTIAPNAFKGNLTENDYRTFSSVVGEILNKSADSIYEMTQKKHLAYLVVQRRVEEDVMLKIVEFMRSKDYSKYGNVLHIADDQKRYYPHNNLLSTVLGFVGDDNQGLEGLERTYDSYLKGTPGKIISLQSEDGTTIPFEYENRIEATDGCDIYLTVDIELQYVVEKYIEEARIEHNVQNRAAAIVMDVKTGEILAMTSKPDYDPNNRFEIIDQITLKTLEEQFEYGSAEYWTEYNTLAKSFWKNKLTEQYEPGSTFKIITAAVALEEGLVSLSERFNCSGHLDILGTKIHCNKREGHGSENLMDGLANSCNPVFMTLGLRIGPQKFYDYLTLFGLRDKTDAGVSGEQTGYHHALSALENKINLAESAFGQSFKITPLQLISAVCSIANDGYYMQPYIIKEIIDNNGNIVLSNSPQVVKQTVSQRTSDILCEYLEYTVEHGKMAYLEGYRIAGKTGTSEKLDSLNEEGLADKRIASFIGFAPADDPQVCVLVIVDEPNSEVRYGSAIAAPLAKKVLAEALDHLNIEPDYGDNESTAYVDVPHVRDLTLAEAKKAILAAGLVAKVIGNTNNDAIVTYQLPAASKDLPVGATVVLFTDDVEASRKTEVPNLIGLTAAEANRQLLQAGLNIRIVGENINLPGVKVKKQSHEAGEEVSLATVITVTME